MSHTGASIVRAEVQVCGPDLVSSVTTHGEAKDRPTQSAWEAGMRRQDCHRGQRTDREDRENGVLTLTDRQTAGYATLWTRLRLLRPKLTACVSDVNRGLDVSSR